MRVLFHHRIASRDGQAVHLEELITALQRQGHETVLVGPPNLMMTTFGSSDRLVNWIKRSLPRAAYELLEIAYNVRAFRRLRAAVQVHRPDVVYERFSLFLFAGVWVRLLYGVPLLLEVNAPLYEERKANDGLRLHRLGRWAQRFIWTHADHVLPVSGVLARTITSYGTPRTRITVIPNGVDPKRFEAVPDADSAKVALGLRRGIVLGFTGFIRRWNAIDRLIEFAASHHRELDIHILVVGDGPARQALQEYACARGISDRLTITGVVNRTEIGRYIAAFDIAVIPGLTAYSSPLKLFEYLQLGRAVVAPDTENVREILTNECDSLLFNPGTTDGLEGALVRLCTDPVLRDRLGRSARRTIIKKSLTWDYNAGRVCDLARQLVAQAHPRDCQDTKDLSSRSPT